MHPRIHTVRFSVFSESVDAGAFARLVAHRHDTMWNPIQRFFVKEVNQTSPRHLAKEKGFGATRTEALNRPAGVGYAALIGTTLPPSTAGAGEVQNRAQSRINSARFANKSPRA